MTELNGSSDAESSTGDSTAPPDGAGQGGSQEEALANENLTSSSSAEQLREDPVRYAQDRLRGAAERIRFVGGHLVNRQAPEGDSGPGIDGEPNPLEDFLQAADERQPRRLRIRLERRVRLSLGLLRPKDFAEESEAVLDFLLNDPGVADSPNTNQDPEPPEGEV